MGATHALQKRYPPELRERAVRMVFETIEAEGQSFGVITRIARQLGIGSEGRADLQSAAGRPLDLLRGPGSAALGPGAARCRPEA